VLNTAFIERLNATFRQRLTSLVRRTRALARRTTTLEQGMWLVGTLYNCCTPHESLRVRCATTEGRFEQRTPAQAAQITDHRWSVKELLWYRVPPPKMETTEAAWAEVAGAETENYAVVYMTRFIVELPATSRNSFLTYYCHGGACTLLSRRCLHLSQPFYFYHLQCVRPRDCS